jgi:hypothetical protein
MQDPEFHQCHFNLKIDRELCWNEKHLKIAYYRDISYELFGSEKKEKGKANSFFPVE